MILMSIRPMDANGMLTSNAKGIFCYNVTCFATNKSCSKKSSVRVLQVLLISRLQGYSFQLAFQCVFTAYTLQLPFICVLQTAFSQDILFQPAGKSHWNKLAVHGISPKYQVAYLLCGRMKVPHLMSIRPMECWLATLNASSATMSHALQQTKAAPISHLSGCFKCSSLLACKGTAFNLFSNYIRLSRVHLASTLFPADCFQEIIFEQQGNSDWNKFRFFGHIKLTNLLCGLMKVSHLMILMSIRPMEGWLETLRASSAIMSLCFATNKSCSSRNHLSGCFKRSSLLACKAARVQLSTCFPTT